MVEPEFELGDEILCIKDIHTMIAGRHYRIVGTNFVLFELLDDSWWYLNNPDSEFWKKPYNERVLYHRLDLETLKEHFISKEQEDIIHKRNNIIDCIINEE